MSNEVHTAARVPLYVRFVNPILRHSATSISTSALLRRTNPWC